MYGVEYTMVSDVMESKTIKARETSFRRDSWGCSHNLSPGAAEVVVEGDLRVVVLVAWA